MGAAESTFDFDLEWKKRSSVATILDENSYTFNWIPPRHDKQAPLLAPARGVHYASLLYIVLQLCRSVSQLIFALKSIE